MYAIDLLWSLIEIIICNQGVLQSEISKTGSHGLRRGTTECSEPHDQAISLYPTFDYLWIKTCGQAGIIHATKAWDD